ncbi:MAG: CHAT domain-containing protein [Xenococcaceae cyanobacterium MO_167.B52]|nr:CHAT domain-containing protein [Xenococcaceae cyanobacterium MO_167.B52]
MIHKKQLDYGEQIRLLFKIYQRIFTIILLGLLGLTTTVSIPALTQNLNAYSLLKQGIELYESQQFASAIEVWQQSASVLATEKDNLTLALVWSNLSSAYQDLGRWQEAETAIMQSLKLLKNLDNLADSPTYLEIIAKALNNRGSLEWSRGQLNQALESWQQATAKYAQAGNQTGVIGSSINQAKALQSLGLSLRAEETLARVQGMLEQESDPNLKAVALQNLGQALRRIGKLEASEQILETSLSTSKLASALLELGNTQTALANRATARGKEAAAQSYTQQAIASYQRVANTSSPERLQAQLNLLSLWIKMEQWSRALDLLPTIEQEIAILPPSRTAIEARINLAESLIQLWSQEQKPEFSFDPAKIIPNFSKIESILTIAVQQARNLSDLPSESYALGQLGRLYELNQQWDKAQKMTQQAFVIAQELQAPAIGYRWEWQLGRLFKQQGDREKAIAEYMAAVASLKSVRSDLLTINSDVQFSFRDNVAVVYRELVDLLLNAEPNQENLAQAIENIDSLQLAEVENFLGCDLSSNSSLVQEIEQSSLLEKQSIFDTIDPQAAFIYPIILKDRLEVIFKLPGQPLRHQSYSIAQTAVENTLRALRRAILRSNAGLVIEKSQLVYGWLIEPFEPYLESNQQLKTLVFVLDGYFRNIPMGVLYDSKNNEYLIEKNYALALLPSVQMFDLRALPERLRVLGAGISQQLQVGNYRFNSLNVIPELEQIKQEISSEILLNTNFTQSNIQQNLDSGDFSIVHLATHGNFSSDPEETYLLVYGGATDTGKLFKARDLDNLLRRSKQERANPLELLVLSACQTAEGDERATLGLAGLAIRAGTRSTLATLWQVSDESTVKLMKQFYHELNTPGVTKAQALHRAQQALLNEPNYQAPYYWASYVLVGNWF